MSFAGDRLSFHVCLRESPKLQTRVGLRGSGSRNPKTRRLRRPPATSSCPFTILISTERLAQTGGAPDSSGGKFGVLKFDP